MTMKLIQTIAVGSGGAGFVTFSNIPQTYADLVLVISARIGTTTGSIWGDTALQFNGSSSGYSGRFLYGASASGVGSAVEGTSVYNIVRIQSNDGTANMFSSTSIRIPNYTSSNPKSISYESVSENNGTSSIQTIHTGVWNNTAAITALGVSTSIFVENSTFSLYGISSGSGASSVDLLKYDFNTGTEGWTAANATLSASGGILIQSVTGNDPYIMSPAGISFSGFAGRYLKIVVNKLSPGQSNGWDGSVFYVTPGHGYSESYKGMMPEPNWDGSYKTITLDMWNPHAGGSDWQNSTITGLRLDFANISAAGDFLIESISVSQTP